MSKETSYARTHDGTRNAPSEQGFDTMWSTSLTSFFQRRASDLTIGIYGTVRAG